ncbi:TBC1 domain family member 13 isoform X1 [Phymastichus coffea]|uniref:TBC1 domain family member 13 isoform X1 n=1 Tax=Phymastichus coffea TaxID=108790 RepID=UPI00273CC5ED|nr:TBC1 domain family member 13 isoform X1 [Phymastichus coffea]
MSILKKKVQEFEDCLSAKKVDPRQLKKLCFNGIPDQGSLRPLCWKLLLNYMPYERDKWNETLKQKRDLYKSFIDDLIVIPGESNLEAGRVDVTTDDHPLNLDPDSKWQTFFKDNEVLLQIDKDVRRLCPDISFFQQGSEYPCEAIINSNGQKRLHQRVHHTVLKSASVERKGLGVTKIAVPARKAIEDYAPLEGGEAHWEVLERVLFLYAKLNPGQGYVQGMNEIVGPIYYAFACDPDQKWREHAEADTFFCFTNLMAEIRDFFIKSLDEAEFGINAMMNKLMHELKISSYEIWMRLNQQELCPQYYSFRWLTLLLSQEFPLPDVMRIWDSLFSDENRFEFLIHICCAMILLCKEQILTGDFAANVKMLQNFPSTDVQIVLSRAAELAEKTSL